MLNYRIIGRNIRFAQLILAKLNAVSVIAPCQNLPFLKGIYGR